MINQLKKIWLISLLGLFLVTPVFAQTAKSSNYGLDKARDQTTMPVLEAGSAGKASTSLAITSGKLIGAVLAFLGVIFLILIIYGGIMWMVVPSNDKGARKAKDIITAAVVGLIIVLSAYALTQYIGDSI